MNRFRFGLKSAYGQLILLVFLPIVVLALVGGYLVFSEVRRAVLSEQDVLAQAALLRYETAAEPLLSQIGQDVDSQLALFDSELANKVLTYGIQNRQDVGALSGVLEGVNSMRTQRVQRLAIIKHDGSVLHAMGVQASAPWGAFDVNAPHVLAMARHMAIL